MLMNNHDGGRELKGKLFRSTNNLSHHMSLSSKVGVTCYQHHYVSILLSSQMSDEKIFKHLLAEGRKGGILLS